MSENRHSQALLVPVMELAGPVWGTAFDYPTGTELPWHRHDAAQLIYAVTGVMTVRTGAGHWVVPPQRAVWVPLFEEHAIRMTGAVGMRTVYVRTAEAEHLWPHCNVVSVTPLLREIVLRIMEFDGTPQGAEARLVGVFFDEMHAAQQMPLHLPMPSDPRLLRITTALSEQPGDQRTLSDWGRLVGASERTLARLFVAETQLTFGQWSQQARLLRALERLAVGDAVTTVALDLGYAGPSAFIAMFRRAMGTTPAQYFRSADP